ncbi:hypothetical protein QMK17_25940 [Rhodococcus sp. G-MC3]|uniref:hypothetical protein n=1 Tax=Rhodococcus sp. G-MC3 TaxID=3046209 RepID=UPI0024BB9944|nr:hypothetical protein [Rhodococcus sp. G-MC3]MDJ0396733.1 hypothetical protein [Rhodococcus sp. G-MC3]
MRTVVGINPNDSIHLGDSKSVEKTPEIVVFEQVMAQLGVAVKRHVKRTYTGFIHLRNELALAADGHRPVNERFRSMADISLRDVADELGIPRWEVGGPLEERLATISDILTLSPVMGLREAIERAQEEYDAIDMRTESDRASVIVTR